VKYIRKLQTVLAVQITRDIDMIAPAWFIKELEKEKVVIDRAIVDGHETVYGCTVYFYGGRQRGKIGDYIIKDNLGALDVIRGTDFNRLFEEG